MTRPSGGRRLPAASTSEVVGLLRRYDGLPPWSVAVIVVTSILGGALEALGLLMFVRAATAAATDDIVPVEIAGRTIGGDPSELFLASLALVGVAVVCHVLATLRRVDLSRRASVAVRRHLITALMDAPWS